MQETEIRIMSLSDIEQVSVLEQGIFSEPWSRQSFEAVCNKDDKLYLVCDVGGAIAGYCGAWISFDEADITNVAVSGEYRKQGLATQLLERLLDFLCERNVNTVFLEVRCGNIAARSLYTKLGFAESGIRKKYYHNPVEDAVIMTNELKNKGY